MMRNIRQSNARRGGQKNAEAFTLTELVTVVAAVALLILAGMAAVSEFRYKSRELACMANLRQLGVAMSLYEKGNGGRLPFAFIEYSPDKFISWDRLIEAYAPSGSGQSRLFRCPADTIPAGRPGPTLAGPTPCPGIIWTGGTGHPALKMEPEWGCGGRHAGDGTPRFRA